MIDLPNVLENPCATASIKKPIHNVKELRADPASPTLAGRKTFRFISGGICHQVLVEPIGIEPMT
ncbi:hypothetical protein [Novosphingobium soli]|uniref:Uncharacterized protein n=1 Tax=Novosphingobium soli TaxID=574956 RepID=A0ABV6CQA6_9SPHN